MNKRASTDQSPQASTEDYDSRPRKRRAQSLESAHRRHWSGFPDTWDVFPRVGHEAFPEHSDFETKYPDIVALTVKLAKEYDIQWRLMGAGVNYHPAIRGVPTFYVEADYAASGSRWPEFTSEVQRNFREKFDIDIAFETCDMKASKPVPIYDLNDHPIVEHWGAYIRELTQKLPRSSWTTIFGARRGWFQDLAKNPPTVVVTSPLMEESDHDEISRISKAALRTLNLHDVEVFVCRSHFGKRAGQTAVDKLLQNCRGSSLCYRGDDENYGTLGAAVRLKGDAAQYIITNKHVVQPDRETSPVGMIVSSPSNKALRQEISGCQSAVGIIDRRVKAKQERLNTSDTHGQNLQDEIDELNTSRATFCDNEKHLTDLLNNEFGEVIACSDDQPHVGDPAERWALDWALVRCRPDKKVATEEVYDSVLDIPIRDNEEVPKFGVMSMELPCFKKGAASGITLGHCFTIKPIMNLPGVWGKAWLVMPKPRSESKYFAEPGDSGSLVISEDSEWLGLLFGGDSYGYECYVTPFSEIAVDIGHQTGKDMICER